MRLVCGWLCQRVDVTAKDDPCAMGSERREVAEVSWQSCSCGDKALNAGWWWERARDKQKKKRLDACMMRVS